MKGDLFPEFLFGLEIRSMHCHLLIIHIPQVERLPEILLVSPIGI